MDRGQRRTSCQADRRWNHQLTARRVTGGARPGRWMGVPLRRRRTGANTPWQLEGQHLTDRRSVCHSQRIGGKDHQCAEGGLSGNPVRAERAERGWTPRVRAEGHAGRGGGASGLPNLQDRARRRVPAWRTTALGASRPAERAAFALHKNSLKVAAYLEAVEDGCFSSVDERVHDKHVCRRRRGKECERLGVSTVSP